MVGGNSGGSSGGSSKSGSSGGGSYGSIVAVELETVKGTIPAAVIVELTIENQ